jgi:hypothetical protein
MPLKEGTEPETISENIRRELHAHPNMDRKQAAAIAYSKARGDVMPLSQKVDAIVAKTDAIVKRFDEFMTHRRLADEQKRIKMADARTAKYRRRLDAFEEARHPRNAGGSFTPGGEEAEEKGEKTDTQVAEGKEEIEVDTQIDPGSLSKRNIEAT